jgi:hypothetical protein
MGNNLLGVIAAVALLASVGVANAKGPVTLTDGQLDKVTAGDSSSQTEAFLVGVSTNDLDRLLTFSNLTLGFLNGVPLTLPTTLPTITTP